jgi:ATP-binding cassette subfamily F protein 3
MSLLTADSVSILRGKKVILDAATFAVQPGEKIGLCGPNGSGKSTLLRLLNGELESDEGEIIRARGVQVGYLPQDVLELPGGPLVESVQATVGRREALAERLAAVEQQLAEVTQTPVGDGSDDEVQLSLAGRLAELHAELQEFEERFGRHRAEEILSGLGFARRDFDRPVSELSGGWKMRAALAGLLLLGPDLLLLDEPTNHLDIPSLEWFDEFLRRSARALVLVSHDREFLDRQVKRILSFEPEGLRSYPGNHASYRVQREEEERNLELRAKRQAAQRAEALRFIERFRARNTKAKAVQSRIKRLEKDETIQVRQQRTTVRFRFPEVARSGRDVIRLEGVAKAYGDKVVYRNISGTIHRGERVAIVGVNGAGKTTLLKLVAGELPADAGTIDLGHLVQPAYYAQHHTDTLDGRRTVLEEIAALVPTQSQTFVRGVLGAFLFSGDDVDKKISVLSGGERARVALARLLVLPANLLIMDEPTNHLDLDSSERLVESLKDYGGTLLFVSHNKSFVNALATQVWEINVEASGSAASGATSNGGEITVWPGNLDQYLERRRMRLAAAAAEAGSAPAGANGVRAGGEPETDKQRRQREAREREARAVHTRPLKAELSKVETEIAQLEAEQKELEVKLADPSFYDDFARAQPATQRFAAVKSRLEQLYARWEELGLKLAELEA